jgi:galactose mutarotase-like enzyme
MHELKDENQVIQFSETGGTIISWKFKGTDIFFPQQEMLVGGEKKLRGGMHVCFPNFGKADKKFGLPNHGTIRNRQADTILEDSMVFRGCELLGPNYSEECAVLVSITLNENGFRYSLFARLLQVTPEPIYTNIGFHPYFRTPNEEVKVVIGTDWTQVKTPIVGPVSKDMTESADVLVPGIGRVNIIPQEIWKSSLKATIWRDSPNYVCVEPSLGKSEDYGTDRCPQLPREGILFACDFVVNSLRM